MQGFSLSIQASAALCTTNTFPFCQRAIWVPLLNKKELEALLSCLLMVVATVQRELCAAGWAYPHFLGPQTQLGWDVGA